MAGLWWFMLGLRLAAIVVAAGVVAPLIVIDMAMTGHEWWCEARSPQASSNMAMQRVFLSLLLAFGPHETNTP
jgi:hypothetical protein